MKNFILSILMITGLSLSSQVNNVTSTKPTITAKPDPANPNSPVSKILCTAGNAYTPAFSDCSCVNITCSNGNKYTWCLCKDGTLFGGAAGKLNNSNNNDQMAIALPFDIEYSVSEDLNNGLEPVARVVNIKKIHDAIITISTTYKFEFSDYILILTPGDYEVKNNKLQTLSFIN
jgi:hypothetical protein